MKLKEDKYLDVLKYIHNNLGLTPCDIAAFFKTDCTEILKIKQGFYGNKSYAEFVNELQSV